MEFINLLIGTENAVHVTYQPAPNSPHEVIFRISELHFQQKLELQEQEQPDGQLRRFYSVPLYNPYSCDQEQCMENGDCEQCNQFEQQQQEDTQELESVQIRQQQFEAFIGVYKPKLQYRHSLKLSAQTYGGAKESKVQCEIRAMCEADTQFCSVQMHA